VYRYVSVYRYTCLFTPSLQRVPWPPPPRWPCGSPPSTVLWDHTTAPRPSPTPRFPLTPGTSAGGQFFAPAGSASMPLAGLVRLGRVNHALVCRKRQGALLCSWGTPWTRAPGLRLRRPWRTLRLQFSRFCLPLDKRRRRRNDEPISELLPRGPRPRCLRFTPTSHPVRGKTRCRPAR